MNRFTRFLGLTVMCGTLLTVAPGCDVLNQEPPDSFTPDDIFSSPSRAENAALGMYDALQNAEFLGGRALIYGDVRSDDTDPSGFFGTLALSTATAGDGNALGAWQGGYRSMYTANYMLQELQRRGTGVLPADRVTVYMGEAKFIRALCHFHLVNLFAQPYNFTPDASHPGIPLQLTAPNGDEAFAESQKQARASVRDVYAQIERDLLDAIQDLPNEPANGSQNVARATKNAARALLSRLYLYKGDNANAARLANDVITTNRHRLNPTPDSAFKSFTTPESIFSIAMNQQDNPNTNNAIGQHYSPPPGRGDITVTPYANALPAGDKRRTTLVLQRSGRLWTKKYINASNGPNNGAWVPIVRYPEVLLNRAEALAKAAGTGAVSAEAVQLLNMVRDRSKPAAAASYTTASFASNQALVTAILTERRFELAFEGHRLYDLFRNGMGVPARGTAPAIPYGSNRAVLPIPLTDLQRNPNLEPNPGY